MPRAFSTPTSMSRVAEQVTRALTRLARPAHDFDARCYFRGDVNLGFYNVGTTAVRELARSIHSAHRHEWSIDEALALANRLIRDRHLEAKMVGIEVVRRYRREFAPRLLSVWKRWLAEGHSANWATTDAICGYLIGPLLAIHPHMAARLRPWADHRSLWVRRASAVSLVASARKGHALDLAYEIATRLQPDSEDLIHKAVGWLLREAGKTDVRRLQRYLLRRGSSMPRTSLRYAIERMTPAQRQRLLRMTRAPRR